MVQVISALVNILQGKQQEYWCARNKVPELDVFFFFARLPCNDFQLPSTLHQWNHLKQMSRHYMFCHKVVLPVSTR